MYMLCRHKKYVGTATFFYVDTSMKSLIVESHSGYRAEEHPLRFHVSGRKIEIVAIRKRWLTRESRFFTVLGDDGLLYDLEYRHDTGTWNLITLNRP